MTQQVIVGNDILRFPDDMDDKTIAALIEKEYGGAQAREGQTAAQVLKGIPILGAYVDQAGAAVSAAANPLTGVGAQGETFQDRYGRNLAAEKATAAEFEINNPIGKHVLRTTGGGLSLIPMGATDTKH
jgi:hypothetical protein